MEESTANPYQPAAPSSNPYETVPTGNPYQTAAAAPAAPAANPYQPTPVNQPVPAGNPYQPGASGNVSSNPYQAPRAATVDAGGVGARLSVMQVYTSLEGRIPRKVYWIYRLVLNIPVFAVMGVLGVISAIIPFLIILYALVALPVFAFVFWCNLAITVKRWHDLNKSGWWYLIHLVPIVGFIWGLVEAGCTRGTEGANDFGGDPTGLYDEKLF